MPYIKQEDRPKYENAIAELVHKTKEPGELNYVITRLLLGYLGPIPRYRDYNEVRGVLGCVTDEYYRRWVGPYEDQAIARNGDIDG